MKPTFTLHSPETKTDYVIFVAPPREKTEGPWTTVLFMDGDNQFSAAVAAYRRVRAKRKVPPLLLVGIGYGASYGKAANKRGRDYTPTAHSDEPTSGGADLFLKFLRRTFWPELARRYPVREDIRGIAGHSLGSLLVLHALFRQPPFFTHHLASAPSIWWDNRSLLQITARRRTHNPALAAELFLCAGERDSESMAGDLVLFEQQLATRKFRGLRVTSVRFPRRNHYDVLPDAFGSGLIALFGRSAK
jgi:predicted alpha/beta superfamily hydrolase